MGEVPAQAVDKLTAYHGLLEQVLAAAGRHQIEEAARVLAAHVGYYQKRFGKIAMEETLASLHAEHPNPEQLAELVHGMETLIAVLMLATDAADHTAGRA